MAQSDADKLKALKDRKKRVEGVKLETASIKGAKTKAESLKTETKKESD